SSDAARGERRRENHPGDRRLQERAPARVITPQIHAFLAFLLELRLALVVTTLATISSRSAEHAAEGKAHGHWCPGDRTSRLELARVLVDAEGDDRVGVLIADQHQPARWVDVEPARNRPLG